jgi:hypothetical protein
MPRLLALAAAAVVVGEAETTTLPAVVAAVAGRKVLLVFLGLLLPFTLLVAGAPEPRQTVLLVLLAVKHGLTNPLARPLRLLLTEL